VQKGELIEIESIVSDIDGKLIANRDVEIKAVLKDWTFDKGAWNEKTIDEQTCNIKSADKGVICKFTAKAGGRYTITASVMDDRERLTKAKLRFGSRAAKPFRNAMSSRKKRRSFRTKKNTRQMKRRKFSCLRRLLQQKAC
jgi:hypothetical protein